MCHLTFRKLLRSLVDLLTGGFPAAPAEKLDFVHGMLLVRHAHLFGLCAPSYFHLFFAYVSALNLQQEVRPEQVAAPFWILFSKLLPFVLRLCLCVETSARGQSRAGRHCGRGSAKKASLCKCLQSPPPCSGTCSQKAGCHGSDL